jgi:alkanesulfonate monooxygenase SsuD/methylene tetrahydromethanopterin reductase-like flavin-dependent oxidoreductase (luciferase family)
VLRADVVGDGLGSGAGTERTLLPTSVLISVCAVETTVANSWLVQEPGRSPRRSARERTGTMVDMTATGGPRPLRFGVVAPLRTDLPTWRDRVRRIADSGYSTLLMPDVQQWQPAPGPTLAVAATLTDLRVGTWVYASPLRAPWNTAWEAHSLSVLTEGRFEMGIGTGRPGIEDELHQLGLPAVTPGERLSQVREAVASLRALDGHDFHTPVVMAVRGPKARALAVDLADTVTFVAMPGDSRAEIMHLAADLRAIRDVELALHVPVVGDAVSAFMAPPDTDPAALRAADSLSVLPGDPTAAIEEVLRRREEGGFSYVVVGANAADALAPVVAELTGH